MYQSLSMKDEPSGPEPAAIALSVFLTSVFGVVVFGVALAIAKDSYRTAHQLAPVETGFWIFSGHEDAPVSLSQVGVMTIFLLVAVAAVYAIFLHPVLGRLVQTLAEALTRNVITLYRLEEHLSEYNLSKWDPSASVVFGSAWPITMVSIPLLFIALIVGRVYRALWSWR